MQTLSVFVLLHCAQSEKKALEQRIVSLEKMIASLQQENLQMNERLTEVSETLAMQRDC